jgi:5-methylcytosine-specific restriction endonuclease McrA
MNRLLLLLIAFLALAVPAATAAPPPGATALCQDGTYSFSQHRSGTCSHHGGVARWLVGNTRTKATTGRSVLLGRRTARSGCVRSTLPDRRCSPGAYYARLTKSVICARGFHTGAIRDVPQAEKFAVEREYGMAAAYYGYSIEIDHIVPLELGGSNSIANLFPEPGSGAADYHVKDAAENRAKEWVCEGRLSLAAARRGFAADWESLYRRLFGHAPGG